MDLNEFVKRNRKNNIDNEDLALIYERLDCINDKNREEVEFLLPAIDQLCYYKKRFCNNTKECYDNNYYGVYNLFKENEKIIYKMIDKGIEIKDISNLLFYESKKTLNVLLQDYTDDGELPNFLYRDFEILAEEGMSEDEAKKYLLRGTYSLKNTFDKICTILNL